MIDDRFELRAAADERTVLTVFLDWHRGRLVHKCAGLSDEQLRLRAVPSSKLSLIGLMRHMAGNERWWIQTVIGGERRESLFSPNDDNADFNEIESATWDETFTLWRAEVDESRRVIADLPLEASGKHPITGTEHSLRWVFNHMIDEYARHNGHADLLRETIDGTVGE